MVANKQTVLTSPQEVCQFLTGLFSKHKFDIRGLIKSDGDVIPLPTESATLGNIIQSALIRFLRDKCVEYPELHITPAKSSRAYPDISLTGPIFSMSNPVALDVKCAQRQSPKRIKSSIAIATYDTYFREPDKKFPTLSAPYGSFWCHLALIALYDLVIAEVKNVEIFAVEGWRIASRREASGTRCYVGSVTDIARLKAQQGEFSTVDEYYEYWRSYARKPKVGRQASEEEVDDPDAPPDPNL